VLGGFNLGFNQDRNPFVRLWTVEHMQWIAAVTSGDGSPNTEDSFGLKTLSAETRRSREHPEGISQAL
jgi:hypothetical protein